MEFLISDVLAQGIAAGGEQQSGVSFLFMILLFIGLMYFLVIRPQMKQAKEHRQLIEALQKGDEVSLAGGLVGKIREVGDNFILLEVAKDVEIKVQKKAVSATFPKGTLKSL